MKKGVLAGFIVTLMIIIALPVSAREVGNGKIITKTISVGEYTSLTIGGDLNFSSSMFNGVFGNDDKDSKVCRFDYKQVKGNPSLSVTIDENLFPFLVIENIGHDLKINVKKGKQITPTQMYLKGTSGDLNNVSISNRIDFYVIGAFSTESQAIRLSGSGDIKMKDPAKINSCSIHISGAGDLNAENLTCDTFEAQISGAGDIDLKGKANTASCRVSGAGDIDAFDFEVKNLTCSVSGAGDLKIYATERLDASVSGTGDISYKGNAVAKTKVSGFGEINKVK